MQWVFEKTKTKTKTKNKQKKNPLSQNCIFLYFCTGTKFYDLRHGACHYEVTKAKPWEMLVLNLVSMFRGQSNQIKHHTGVNSENLRGRNATTHIWGRW